MLLKYLKLMVLWWDFLGHHVSTWKCSELQIRKQRVESLRKMHTAAMLKRNKKNDMLENHNMYRKNTVCCWILEYLQSLFFDYHPSGTVDGVELNCPCLNGFKTKKTHILPQKQAPQFPVLLPGKMEEKKLSQSSTFKGVLENGSF